MVGAASPVDLKIGPGGDLFFVDLSGGAIRRIVHSGGPVDTTPPVRSNGAPSGTLVAGTTQTTLSLATNENATCRYGTVAGVAYGSMTNTFAATGSMAHSTTVSELTHGGSYSFFVRCQDTAGNANTNDFTISFSVAQPPQAGAGLVAAYGFNEGSGTSVGNAAGSSHTGTISGATWSTQGKFGNALSYDGVNDWVTVADAPSLDLTTGMTLEAWVFPTATNGVRDIIIKEGSNVDIYNLYARNWRGLPEANVFVGGSNRTAEGASLPANVWTHVAGTYDGSTVRLFINGVQAASTTISGSIATSTGPLRIGGNSMWGEFFQGRIDEVRIYNRALTQAEIQSDMNTPIGSTSNTAPTVSAIAAQTTNEDTATGASAFTVGDAQTAAGSLTVSGTSSNTTLVPNGNIIFAGSGANRTVTITPAANQNGTATITVTVSDGQLSTPTSFQLTVTALNDAPTITSIANQTTTSGTAMGPLSFTVGDVETPANSLAVSGSSSNTTVVPNGNIVFGGSGANRTVTVTPAVGQTGTTTITVTVSDGQVSTPTSFQLTVNASNTAPTISAIANQTTNEDTTTSAIAFMVGDAQTAAGSLTVSGSSNNTVLVPNGNIAFGGSGANRTVTITPAANQNGVVTITVTVSDGQLSTPTSFQLTVTAVNDAPTITSIGNQTTTVGVAVGPLNFTLGDVEASASSLTVSGNSNNTTLVPIGNIVFGGTGANRTVTVMPAAGQNGTANITMTVSDGQLSTSTSFQLTVNSTIAGLVAAYGFNEGSGTSVSDASGNGRTGTISGATWSTQGKFGNALSFDGVNDWVTVADAPALDLTTGMTLEAWVFPTATNGVRDIIIKEGSNVDIYNLYARNGGGRPESNVFVSGSNRTAEGTALSANAWTHVAGTYDGTTLRLFINGVQAASTTISGSIATSNGPLRIGGNSIWGEFFRGRIDEIRIYNRALTQAEIQVDMNTPVGPSN
jgi:Concanavalin A-like lectin/glucanases superfamily/Bacterial Ig domain/Cadherin-like domain